MWVLPEAVSKTLCQLLPLFAHARDKIPLEDFAYHCQAACCSSRMPDICMAVLEEPGTLFDGLIDFGSAELVVFCTISP